MQSQRTLGTASLIGAAFVIAAACYFSYRSGCVFDGKQGLGDLAASKPFSLWSLASVPASGLLFAIGVGLLSRHPFWPAFSVGLGAFVVLAIPLSFFALFSASISGTQACNPAAQVSPNNSFKPKPLRGSA
jgi:hypothetical protein